jgi:signal transduction histidine kinase
VTSSAVAAGTLALGSYLLVRDDRFESFAERSLREARLASSVAEGMLGDVEARDPAADLIDRWRERAGFEAVLLLDGRSLSTGSLVVKDIPSELRTPGAPELTAVEAEINDSRYLAVRAADVPEAELVFFFPERQVEQSLAVLAGILWRLWLLVVVGAALVGNILARRTLRPVARASAAARSLAEGLLDTRLPVEREDEFGGWAISFNEMADALQEKIVALEEARVRERRFTSNVSHELRTPLTAMVSSASLLQGELERMPQDARWAAQRLIDQIHRVRRLLEELMEISRFDAGSEEARLEQTDLERFFQSMLTNRGWMEEVELDTNGLVITTDRRRLERIFSNLIENALDHGGKPVRVLARRDPADLVVTVADRGAGIPPHQIGHIFDRFYKGDPARSGGSGLGLSIAWENARLLGGTIEVASEPGNGTEFRVRIPLENDSDLYGERGNG